MRAAARGLSLEVKHRAALPDELAGSTQLYGKPLPIRCEALKGSVAVAWGKLLAPALAMLTRRSSRSRAPVALRWLLALLWLCVPGLSVRLASAQGPVASEVGPSPVVVSSAVPSPAVENPAATMAPAAAATAERPATAAPQRRRTLALDLGVATRIPLSAGPELSLELPGRLLLQAHLGWMPGAYSRAITGALRGGGVYDEAVQSLINSTLESVSSSSLSAGWRPFSGAGLELFAGYTRISLSGSTSSSEVIPVVARDIARQLREELGLDVDLRLKSSVHALRTGLAWRWLMGEHIVLRASVEYMKAFASSSRLTISSSPELTGLAAPTAQQLLNSYYLRYVSLPLVGLSLSLRFG